MEQDSVRYDSTGSRPLPKWLTDQRDGLNKYQPEIRVMKEDRTLAVSLIATGIAIVLAVGLLTVYVLRKTRKK